MQYLYKICGIRVLCEVPFRISMQRESEEFLDIAPENNVREDIKMIFRPVDALPILLKKGHWENDRLYIENEDGQKIYHCPTRNSSSYACVTWPEKAGKTVWCEYVRGMESYMNYSHNLCDLLGLETLLLKESGLLLHSSFIRWRGKGILFSAPSGTGKSTQAELWARYEGAEILNGDRAGLRQIGGEWTAFGLPLAGSSFIYRNESALLEGIIVLRQAGINRIRRLKPVEAFRYLYPETTVHQWHRSSAEKAVSLLMNLISQVPVFLLECRPDEEAVRLLKETIVGLPTEGE